MVFIVVIYFWAKNLVLFPKASVRLFKKYFVQIFHHLLSLYEERGKAGGHEPPLFPLPWYTLAFFSFGSHEPPLFPLLYHYIWLFRAKLLFYMVYLGPLQGDFKKSNLVTRGRESRVPQIVITATQICFAASALLNW